MRIDVEQLLRDREAERAAGSAERADRDVSKSKVARKRKADSTGDDAKAKKQKMKSIKPDGDISAPTQSPTRPIAQRVTLKLPPHPREQESFPCCLCVSTSRTGLLKVQDPPLWRKEGESSASSSDHSTTWFAHEECANVVPETWVDEIDSDLPNGTHSKQRVVFGVDAIVKDRWNLVLPSYYPQSL